MLEREMEVVVAEGAMEVAVKGAVAVEEADAMEEAVIVAVVV
eukprot:gene20342-25818_t